MATKAQAQASSASSPSGVTPLAKSPLLAALAFLEKHKVSTNDVVPLDSDYQRKTIDHISTRSFIIDYLIGGRPNEYGVAPCPGFPRGRIIQLYGREASGKTTLALQACAEIISKGGVAAYIDWENEVVPAYAQRLGIPVKDKSRFMLVQPETLEDGFKYIVAFAQMGVPLIVLDSVGAAIPNTQAEVTIDEEGKDIRMAILAAKWSQFLPKMKKIIAMSNTCVIAISQIRDKISNMPSYGEQVTVQGGNAWKFYSSVRIYLRPAGQEKSKVRNLVTGELTETVTGMRVKARLDKCKVSDAAHHEMELYFKNGKGTDDIRSMVDMGVNYKLIKKSAGYTWIDPEGVEIKGRSLDKFLEALRAYPNFESIFMAQLQPKLSNVEVIDSSITDDDDNVIGEEEAGDIDADTVLRALNAGA